MCVNSTHHYRIFNLLVGVSKDYNRIAVKRLELKSDHISKTGKNNIPSLKLFAYGNSRINMHFSRKTLVQESTFKFCNQARAENVCRLLVCMFQKHCFSVRIYDHCQLVVLCLALVFIFIYLNCVGYYLCVYVYFFVNQSIFKNLQQSTHGRAEWLYFGIFYIYRKNTKRIHVNINVFGIFVYTSRGMTQV